MIAVDDGLWSGNYNAADVFFLIGTVLAVVAAVLAVPRPAPSRLAVWAPVLLYLAVGCGLFAWLLL